MSACQDIDQQVPEDIASNTVLLVTIALSYAHQVCRIKFQNSPLGLSPYFVLFNTLFATTQYSNFLLFSCYRYPILSCIAKQELRGLHAYVAILGLLQVAIVWLGSMMLLIAYVAYSHPRTRTTAITIPLLATIHTVLVLGHTAFVDLPHPSLLRPSTISAYSDRSRTIRDPFSLIYLVLALGAQAKSQLFGINSKSHSPFFLESRLNSTLTPYPALSMQALCLIAVGASWAVRLRDLSFGASSYSIVDAGVSISGLWRWYASWAWPWVNWAVYGLGQGCLAVTGWWFGRERKRREADGYVLLVEGEV